MSEEQAGTALDKSETRAELRIRKAVEAAGGEVDFMEYEPRGANVEMQGPSGGWNVFLKGGGHVGGYSASEVVGFIERFGLDPERNGPS